MEELIDSHMIFFNSSSRNVGEIYNLTSILPSDLLKWNQDERGELELISFSAKSSFYNIDNLRNNSFYLVEGVSTTACTLEPGNYNVIELSAEIQTKLNAVSVNYTWGVSYNTKKNKFIYTYTLTGTPQAPIGFNFTLETNKIFGFTSNSHTFTASPELSSTLVSIGNIESLLIYCNWVRDSRHLDSIQETNHNHSKVLAQIPIIGSSFFSTIYWETNPSIQYKMKFPDSHNTNILSVSLRDKESNLVQLTEDYTMVFKLNIYKKMTMNKSLDNLVKLLTLNSIK